MTELHMRWIKAAAETASYRRMYLLAMEIVGSDLASRELRKAAKRVVRVLESVIELPIADANVLARARLRFSELVAVLTRAPGGQRSTQKPSPGQNDRATSFNNQ